MKEINYYRVRVNKDEPDETGLFGISLTPKPANEADFIHMSSEQKADIKMNEEKRIISGVVLRPKQLIARYNPELEYWYMEEQDIKDMVEVFFRDNYNNNVNIDHKIYGIEGVNIIESYFIDRKRNIDPVEFKSYEDSSWIVSYKVNSDVIWNEVKNGTFKGFSIDGYIEKKLVKTEVKLNESKSKIDKLNETIKEYQKQLSENNEDIEISVIDYVNEYVK